MDEKNNDHQIGQRIKRYRKLRRLSQKRLAERIGITYQQLQKYEVGRNRVAATRLQSIAGALGVPVAALYGQAGATPYPADLLTAPECQVVLCYRRLAANQKQAFLTLLGDAGRHDA